MDGTIPEARADADSGVLICPRSRRGRRKASDARHRNTERNHESVGPRHDDEPTPRIRVRSVHRVLMGFRRFSAASESSRCTGRNQDPPG